MPRKKLKLFVWEEVLCDYTCGVMFALAYDAEHARELIKERDNLASQTMENDLKQEPLVVSNPQGFKVWGGG